MKRERSLKKCELCMIFKFHYGTDAPEVGLYIIKNLTERNQAPKGIEFFLCSWLSGENFLRN